MSTPEPKDRPRAPAADYPFLGPPERPDEIGRLGTYRVLGELGRGGMGVVFKAEDRKLRRLVALKIMLPKFAADPRAKSRFGREARAQAAVEHDNVAAIYYVGEDRGTPFLSMPLLKGMTLAAALRANPRPPLPEVVRIGKEMARGLAAAHEKGLIHRDIKPANIWLEGHDRRVKILDFGLARVGTAADIVADADGDDDSEGDTDAHAPLTRMGASVGTAGFMAPEQALARPVDSRADLFSLGVVLYLMATGRPAFFGITPKATARAAVTETPTEPATLNPGLPPALNALIVQLLEKNPDARPQTAEAVAATLRDIEQALTAVAPMPALPTTAGPDPWAEIGATRADAVVEAPPSAVSSPSDVGVKSRKPWILAAAGGLVILAAGVVTATQLFGSKGTGTLAIETDDPEAEVVVKRDGKVVRDRTRDRELKLQPGTYTLTLPEPKEGVRIVPDTVTVAKNERESVRIRVQKKPAPPPTPPAPPPAPESQWFNEKEFKEWASNKVGEWHVENGVLVGTVAAKDEKRPAALELPRAVGDFDLSFDARVRYHEGVNTTGTVYTCSLHFRRDVPRGVSGAMTLSPLPGQLYQARQTWVAAADTPVEVKRAYRKDDFNTYRLVATGNRVAVTVNDLPVSNLVHDFLPAEGSFVWSMAQGVAEVRVRNVKFKELPRTTPPPLDPERKAAALLVPHASLTLKVGTNKLVALEPGGALPAEPFVIAQIAFPEGDPFVAGFVTDTFLPAVAWLPALTTIHDPFRRVRWTDEDVTRLADANVSRTVAAFSSGFSWSPKTIDALARFPVLTIAAGNAKQADDAVLSRLKELKGVTDLGLAGLGASEKAKVTGKGWAAVAALPLRTLHLGAAALDVPAARAVAGMPRLISLDLRGVQLEDEAAVLAELARSATIADLHLDRGTVGDEGLAVLARLAALRTLDVRKTRVTKKGIDALNAARPDVRIVWDSGPLGPKS